MRFVFLFCVVAFVAIVLDLCLRVCVCVCVCVCCGCFEFVVFNGLSVCVCVVSARRACCVGVFVFGHFEPMRFPLFPHCVEQLYS